MTRNTLLNSAILLIAAIIGVIGYKLSPMLRPNADITLPGSPCNLGLQACTTTLPNGGRLELSIEPRPIRPLQPLQLSVSITGLKADTMEIDFDGSEMKMGYNRPVLTASNGRFAGQTILPVCVSGTMEWTATVLVTTDKRRIAIPFNFEIAGR